MKKNKNLLKFKIMKTEGMLRSILNKALTCFIVLVITLCVVTALVGAVVFIFCYFIFYFVKKAICWAFVPSIKKIEGNVVEKIEEKGQIPNSILFDGTDTTLNYYPVLIKSYLIKVSDGVSFYLIRVPVFVFKKTKLNEKISLIGSKLQWEDTYHMYELETQ